MQDTGKAQRKQEGVIPTKFLIIDEGWQNKVMAVEADADETDSPYHATSVDRLTSIEESEKVKGFRSGKSYANLREFAKFIKEEYGLKFYDDLHCYLASCNVDVVKVDVQNVLELLDSGYGGRVALMRQYQEALEESSDHYTAEFHAAARALGGCPVYNMCSDKPGSHNFNVLKKLVLPDGSILRARYAGRPARDCLFSDPVLDGKR
ncbi:unnamed protein product [Prunus armeniaca]|uniref:Uncharacterized protein n=1 Tax=Prunus armeniaca TaxID=36596 RepID=A0A6J5XBH8_PRUAR|nr:unnamed protein product [Prunus armeniaca]